MISSLKITFLAFIIGGWYPLSAPSSSISKVSAQTSAVLWMLADPDHRKYCVLDAVQNRSMIPTVDRGSVLLLEKVSASELIIADIAIYESGGQTICHRVREIETDGKILFEGDNNHGTDGLIAPERIRWRVAGILFTRKTP